MKKKKKSQVLPMFYKLTGYPKKKINLFFNFGFKQGEKKIRNCFKFEEEDCEFSNNFFLYVL